MLVSKPGFLNYLGLFGLEKVMFHLIRSKLNAIRKVSSQVQRQAPFVKPTLR